MVFEIRPLSIGHWGGMLMVMKEIGVSKRSMMMMRNYEMK
jgi:hypothetical protein